MKRTFLLLALMLFTLGSTGAFAAEQEVKFSIGEWEPYTGEKLPGYGMAAEIVTAACKAGGLQADYEFSPWKRAENNVSEATSFGTFPYKEIPERQNSYLFSDVLFSNSFGILMNKTNEKTRNFSYSGPQDFQGLKVGIIAGTAAVKNPLSGAGASVDEVPDPQQNLMKLAAGRIDFYIDDKAVIYQALKKLDPTQSDKLVLSQQDFGDKNEWKIMVSKTHLEGAALLAKINEGLKKIKESGECGNILKKYGM